MSNCIKVVVDGDRGATIKSPNFFSVEEVVPPKTTIADIEAGILDGTYTPIDVDLYTYEGKLKADYGQATLVDLNFTVEIVTIDGTPENGGTDTYKVLTFKILPASTATWDNKDTSLLFDIKRTEIADTTNVDIWVKGSIALSAVITE